MIARWAGMAFALAGVVLLVIAEFTTVFEVTVGSLEIVKRSATGGENHGYALLVVAVVATIMALLAARGARAPAVALAVLAILALAIALVVDLPDTRGSVGLPEALAYENAQARARAGFGLEITAAVLLLAAGGLLSAAGHSADRSRTVGRRDDRYGAVRNP